MARWTPDPTFYPSPRLAGSAPPETLGYVALVEPTQEGRPDALGVIDLQPGSSDYGSIVSTLEMPNIGDELHHFGWNACSAALCPSAPRPHVERRYLLVPGLRSSRMHVIDTKPDPRAPQLARTIEGEDIARRTGYSRPHTTHCGPDAIYVSALGGDNGGDEGGGIFLLDCDSFDPLGAWEVDRGPQRYSYDFWWHLGYDTLLSSEWGTPAMFENGVVPEKLLGREYGHHVHVWDLRKRRHKQALDLGDQHQMVLELRPAHDPRKTYGFVGVVVSVEDLSASVWLWHRDGADWSIKKVIEIPAEPAEADQLPELLKGFGAVPPLVTDINLSLDDQQLYVSCWGTGDFLQYDVSDPFNPKETGRVRLGGIASHEPHPASGSPLTGGPQMVEVSRDGRRVYVSNGLYTSWDRQFYPDGLDGFIAKFDVKPGGGMELDPGFLVAEFDGRVPHQVRLEGGDASSDSYCFP
ncbi:MAG TPA: selenium-binding protein SBP56-related protein [Gaiellales bacterium]|jgi:selenium-binding protein 1|nr:selenium-binding protein SBP56-related protein [Gaiellales bacterium]